MFLSLLGIRREIVAELRYWPFWRGTSWSGSSLDCRLASICCNCSLAKLGRFSASGWMSSVQFLSVNDGRPISIEAPNGFCRGLICCCWIFFNHVSASMLVLASYSLGLWRTWPLGDWAARLHAGSEGWWFPGPWLWVTAVSSPHKTSSPLERSWLSCLSPKAAPSTSPDWSSLHVAAYWSFGLELGGSELERRPFSYPFEKDARSSCSIAFNHTIMTSMNSIDSFTRPSVLVFPLTFFSSRLAFSADKFASIKSAEPARFRLLPLNSGHTWAWLAPLHSCISPQNASLWSWRDSASISRQDLSIRWLTCWKLRRCKASSSSAIKMRRPSLFPWWLCRCLGVPCVG